ncbi:hypothetical protein COCCADRAFT_109801 [Bipolaris zeicola 26-R-13]|uniref:Uncharacterized protein n=1 Tax=Cochliobolus carbonum (strain 26-R-13) TaxID=930089 RepID=W6XSC9_COCC2|nr:uncharacterized protein COCCADRAFT_109801 [Bipolaris zeicola 26-R-13]EUC28190.1 hypothetical protein COCCADRAFT_109801 [Bipolaris zeicola 26-R-13]
MDSHGCVRQTHNCTSPIYVCTYVVSTYVLCPILSVQAAAAKKKRSTTRRKRASVQPKPGYACKTLVPPPPEPFDRRSCSGKDQLRVEMSRRARVVEPLGAVSQHHILNPHTVSYTCAPYIHQGTATCPHFD